MNGLGRPFYGLTGNHGFISFTKRLLLDDFKEGSRRVCLLLLGMLSVLNVGCGGNDGPVKYTLSGTITLADGKPCPAGEISLEPDAAGGNKGPGSMAQIKDGKYNFPRDNGIVGGKYNVTITPFDGVAFGESLQGKPLLKVPYAEKVDFPAKDGTKDFKVGSSR